MKLYEASASLNSNFQIYLFQELEHYKSLAEEYKEKLPEVDLQRRASMTASEAAMQNVGSMRIYEIVLGLIFLLIIVDWTF